MSYRSETILSGELSEDRDRKRNNRSNLILMSSHPHLQLTNKQNLNINYICLFDYLFISS